MTNNNRNQGPTIRKEGRQAGHPHLSFYRCTDKNPAMEAWSVDEVCKWLAEKNLGELVPRFQGESFILPVNLIGALQLPRCPLS